MKMYIPEWLQGFPDKIKELKEGKFITVGNKVYGICSNCRYLVQINKTLFGSAHFCE